MNFTVTLALIGCRIAADVMAMSSQQAQRSHCPSRCRIDDAIQLVVLLDRVVLY